MTDPRPRSELLDRVLSASAALVAISALAVSVYQAKITRDQQKMSAWPYMNLYTSNAHGAQFFVQNVGLGPALVRSVEVTVDGRPTRTWHEVLRAVAGRDTSVAVRSVKSDVGRGTVLLPGNAVEFYRLEAPPAMAGELFQAANRDRLVRRVCYCSLYEDCWVADSHVAEPVAVPKCVVDSTRAFRG